MIHITNIRNIMNGEYDEVWAIVRSLKSQSKALKQVTALSPSADLLGRYLALKGMGNWNAQTFTEVYVPQFLREMKENPEAKSALNYLWSQDKQGKNICLVCFCTDETLCHRSIIAGLLQGVGANVVTDTGDDYMKYHQMYCEINKTSNVSRNSLPCDGDCEKQLTVTVTAEKLKQLRRSLSMSSESVMGDEMLPYDTAYGVVLDVLSIDPELLGM